MQEQYKPKMFRVNYQTEHGKGCIMIYVGSFFGRNRLNDAIPFLRFAKTHCTREQQLELLAILKEEKLLHRDTERERIEKTIKKIEAQTWGQSDKGKAAKSGRAAKSGKSGKANKAGKTKKMKQS